MDAFDQGYRANSCYENPYWTNYPNKATDDEVIKARRWVDGYVQKIIDTKRNN
jgi:hypothetical protein